jgi:hypothetical protein
MKGRSGIFEVWVSDDLAATMVDIKSSLDGKSVGRSRLTRIKREGPDPALFQVPEGYKVNPAPEEVPYQSPHKN